MTISESIAVLGIVISLIGVAICIRLDRIVKAIEKLKDK
jgi:hypothetical protein